jgi:hypothetical protein
MEVKGCEPRFAYFAGESVSKAWIFVLKQLPEKFGEHSLHPKISVLPQKFPAECPVGEGHF